MDKPKVYDFSGWATVFNRKCSDGRTILKHAFKSNDGAKVPLVWNHNHSEASTVLGHAYLEEREEGVYAYCCLNNTQAGKDVKELVQHGDICALSIYANQLKQNANKEVTHGVIREVSVVLAGANPGALIDVVLSHSADNEDDIESAEFVNPENAEDIEKISLYHEEEHKEEEHQEENKTEEKQEESKKESEESKKDPEENLEHKDSDNKEDVEGADESIQDIIDTMNEKQKNVLYLLVGAAAEEAKNGGNQDMKHNAFEGITNGKGEELTHSEFVEIITEAKKTGSLKDAFLAHGVTNIERLFPEDQLVNKVPESVQRDQSWVAKVMAAVHKTPFSRVKSTYATMTADEARARGYIKGRQKQEEVIAAFKRSTPPQTVYKLQKLDRDDVIDITDFDVIAWIKGEMRGMLNEELARAFLIGDGRDPSSDDKINPLNIRPIWGDDSAYTIVQQMEKAQDDDDYKFAKKFIRQVVKSRKLYKGSGNPVLYTTEDMLTNMLLIEDKNERVIYDTVEKLKTALRVSDIVTVPVMENAKRVPETGDYDFALMGILVNLNDYNVGADKGGNVALFDDFDINYNKYEYLIETRCSGALVKPYSAIVFEEKVAKEASSDDGE